MSAQSRSSTGAPRARRPLTSSQAVGLGLAAVAVAAAIVWGLAVLASNGTVKARLGDPVFEAGRVDSLAAAIARDGPVPLSDVAGGTTDIILNHEGSDPNVGWVAFAARADGASRECSLSWSADEDVFVDPCDGTTYPPDGEGLTQYRTTVADGRLTVDLRSSPDRPTG